MIQKGGDLVYLKIYGVGIAILTAAVALNLLAGWLGLATWYDVFKLAGTEGVKSLFQQVSLVNWLFLIVIYPFLLGAAAYLLLR
jgi:hypothetical protein